MVRTYKKQPGSKVVRNYTESKVNEVIRKIQSKEISQRDAAKKYNIPRTTLQRRLKGLNSKKHGGQQVIDERTEEQFNNYIITCSMFGFPLDSFDVRCLVKMHLDQNGITIKQFKKNLPGVDWFKGFIRRNTDLTERMVGNIKKQRAKVSVEVMNEFYDSLDVELAGIPPSNIYNFDETNLTDDPGKKKVVTKRGLRYPERILYTSKSSTSIMMCGSADGTMLPPPYVCYKAKEMWTSWATGGPIGARYNTSISGWFEGVTFDDWFKSMVLPRLKREQGTKVLIKTTCQVI